MRKLISIVIPAFNEEECIEKLSVELLAVFTKEECYDFEVIFVENGSTDSTWEKVSNIHKMDSRFKVLRLSRNFAMDGGITAGLEFVQGDACVLMSADLQDPPHVIHSFLREWEKGWENIYAIIAKRGGSSPIRKINSVVFYWLANILTDGKIPRNASDFRLVDKKVYTTVRSMDERNRFVRGLFAWSGFKSKGLKIDRPPRFAGYSKAYTLKVIGLAFKGIFAHSFKPIHAITLVGLGMSCLSITLLVPLAVLWLTSGVPFAGFGSLVAIIILLNSLLFLMLGIIGEYVGLIYEEVKRRPNFIVSESLGINQHPNIKLT